MVYTAGRFCCQLLVLAHGAAEEVEKDGAGRKNKKGREDRCASPESLAEDSLRGGGGRLDEKVVTGVRTCRECMQGGQEEHGTGRIWSSW
jgi:hypothetical protein